MRCCLSDRACCCRTAALIGVRSIYADPLRHAWHTLQLQLKARFQALVGALPLPDIPHGEEGLYESIWLLLTSVITVPLVCKLPGGSPVLGFLVRRAPLPWPLLVAQCPFYLNVCITRLASQATACP